MIKIALPTKNQVVDDHFGHCENYTVISVDENKTIIARDLIKANKGCGCKSGIAEKLRKQQVSVLLAGNMGRGASEKFRIAGIDVVRGCSGHVDELISDYLNGKLKDNGVDCGRHERHHAHHH